MKTIFFILLLLFSTIQFYGQTTNFCANIQYCGPSGNTQLVQNGDFSAGNVGFTSGFPYNPTCFAGSYDVVTEARDKCSSATWLNDLWDWNQNNSTGSYLVIDSRSSLFASPTSTRTIWQQNVYLENGKSYLFSFNILPSITTQLAGQTVRVTVNNQVILTATPASYDQGLNNWNSKCSSFIYNGPTGTFPLILNQVGFNNTPFGTFGDYGIDGISLTTCCSPVEATQPNYPICCGDGPVIIGSEWIPTGNIYWTNNFFTPTDGYGNHTGAVGGAFTNLPCGVSTEIFGNFRLYTFNPCECSAGIHPLEYTYVQQQSQELLS